jgi:oligopeptide transport system permease protein
MEGSVAGYIMRRALILFPTVLIIALITFTLMQMAPGGPWDRDPGRRGLDETASKRLDQEFGLDKATFNCIKTMKPVTFDINTCFISPVDTQFFTYVFWTYDKDGKFVPGAFLGNLGPSYRQRGRTVQDILFTPPEGKPFWNSLAGYSLRLGLIALVFAVVVGLPLGIVAALRHNTLVDYFSLFVATLGVSLPSFVVAIVLIIVFGSWLGWISIASADWSQWSTWVLPAVILGFGTLAFTARLTRSSMLEVMRQDYVRTARAKGLAERVVIWGHMVKNALIPVVTFLGPALAGLVTGSFIIETMFAFPGIGRQYVQSISQRDYSMIMATTLIYGVLVAIANLSVDIVYSFLDPRIRLE